MENIQLVIEDVNSGEHVHNPEHQELLNQLAQALLNLNTEQLEKLVDVASNPDIFLED